MEFNEFKTMVAAAAEKAGLADYELYYDSQESTQVSMFNGEITDFTASLTGGVAFRCIAGGHDREFFYKDERIDWENLQ